MFLENKYSNTYYRIILQARLQVRTRKSGMYLESHHILPKSIWPEHKNCSWNKVLLTAKEHYICHLLLIKMTNGKHKRSMYNAFIYMNSKTPFQQRYSSRSFAYFKEKYISAKKGRVVSAESRLKSSNKQKGEKSYWFGRKRSEKNKELIRQSKLGKPRSEETKKKMSDTKAKTWKITFPDGSISVIKNISAFCREHQLHSGHLTMSGKTKGYQAVRLD